MSAKNIERANKAKGIIDNPMYAESFDLCRLAIIERIEKCPLNDTDTAENLRKCLRLLRDVRANLTEAINAGKLDAFNIQEAETAKKNPFKGLFR